MSAPKGLIGKIEAFTRKFYLNRLIQGVLVGAVLWMVFYLLINGLEYVSWFPPKGRFVLFLFLLLRLIYVAERQPYAFGRVYGYCVFSIFLFHLVINIGMVLGLMPVIGIPLPFFSYGGSSLWGFTLLLFIFLRIDAGRQRMVR